MNKPIVERYFQLLERVMEENNLFGKPTRIYNVDETGLSLVPGVKKIVGKRGMKGSSQITGGERGQLQTVVMATNAAGDYIPPMIIYKGKRMLPELEKDFPPGTIVRLSESGYVNKDLFLEWLEHFCKHVKERDGKTLLVLDGHGSHTLNLGGLLYAAEHCVEIVSMPPHTSHYLQPLDKVHFKPLKEHYKEAVRIHLRNNPGSGIRRADFPKLFRTAYFKVATISNSVNSFRATGLYPLNINEIPDCAYATAEITSRSEAQIMGDVAGHLNNNHQPESNNNAVAVQPEGEDAIAIQPDAEISAVVRPRQEGENATTTHQKESEEDAIAVSSSTSLLISGTNMDSLQQNLDGPELGETSFEDILSFPTIGEKTKRKRTKAINTGTRLLTSKEYQYELGSYLDNKQKKQTKNVQEKNHNDPGKKKRKTAGQQSAIRSTKESLSSTSGISSRPTKRQKKQFDRNDPANICGVCEGNYYDDTDLQDAEGWIQCPVCQLWFHETCAGVYGKAAYDFICSDCA